MHLILLALQFALMMVPGPVQTQSAVISGVVTRSDTGEGIPEAQVTLSPAEAQVTVSAVPDRTALTDTNGRFSFGTVSPGSLRLTVQRDGYFGPAETVLCPRTGSIVNRLPQLVMQKTATVCLPLQSDQAVQNISVQLTPGGTIRGRIVDAVGQPAVNAAVLALPIDGRGVRQSVQTNDRGEFRLFWLAPGNYLVGTTPRTLTPPDPLRTPAPTFFPGSLDPSGALPIDVASGSDQGGIDFAIRTTPAWTISGRVLAPAIAPLQLNGGPVVPGGLALYLIPQQSTPLESAFPSVAINTASRKTEGQFEIRGVRSGRYDLVAIVTDDNRQQHMGRVELDVGSANLENVVVTVHQGVTVSGRVVFAPGVRLNAPAATQNTRIQLVPMNASEGVKTLMAGRIPSVPAPAGTFTISPVMAGQYSVNFSSRWYAVDMRRNGATVFQGGLIVDGQPIDDLEIVVDETARATVAVNDARQQPIPDLTMLLVPEGGRGDRSLIKVALRSFGGAFTFDGLPAGEYRLSAWFGNPPPLELDAESWRMIDSLSVPLRLDAGTVIDLRYAGTPRESVVTLLSAGKRSEHRVLEITPVAPGQASIEGRVWNGSQQAAGTTVVLIPDSARRSDPSQLKTATASGTGYFVFRGGISGRYIAVAFESLPAGALQDPAFLKEQEAKGRVVDVDPAGSVTVQLNVIPR